MEMQMLDRLTSVLTAVGDDAIAVGKACRRSDLGDCLKDAGDRRAVLCVYTVCRGNMLLRNDEDVDRRHRMDVVEGVYGVILVDLGGGDGALDDVAKNTAHGVDSFLYL